MRQRSSTGLKRGGGGGEEERRRLKKHVYMKIPDDKGQHAPGVVAFTTITMWEMKVHLSGLGKVSLFNVKVI